MSELRKDPIVNKWVLLSAARAKRPSDFKDHPQPPPQPGPCPFCPHQEHETGDEVFAWRESAVKCAPDWRVRVVKNLFPAVSQDSENESVEQEGPLQGCSMPGFGSHEVVIETPNHDFKFASLSVENVEEIFKAFQQRIHNFREDKRFKYVQIFKNQGNAAGASMRHSHSQIIALPIIPHDVQHEIDGAKHYYDTTRECILCDMVQRGISDGRRLIDCFSDYVVIAPYAPRYPYETWIVPRFHASNFEDASNSQLRSLAIALLSTLRKMDGAFNNASFNYMLHTSPVQDYCTLPYYHWSLRIVPHLIALGGFELASGCHINPVFPEKAAASLRDINPSSVQIPPEASGNAAKI